MQRTNAKPPRQYGWLEQIAVLASSLAWTGVVLLIIGFVWAYQDAQARWEMIQRQSTQAAFRPPPLSEPSGIVALADTPTPTPQPTETPAPTKEPTATATFVVGPAGVPQILPETPLEDQAPSNGQETPTPTAILPTDTPVPPTNTPTPLASPPPTDTPAPPSSPPPATSGPTRLVIQSVGIDSPVVSVGWSVIEQNGQRYSVWEVADYAAGWHKTSAPPGAVGNTVLAGHHNIKGEVFRYLMDVQEGDTVELYVGDTLYKYKVEQRFIVKEKGEPVEVRQQNAQWIAPTQDERVTLVTCWPYTNNTHRVIVVAKPTS